MIWQHRYVPTIGVVLHILTHIVIIKHHTVGKLDGDFLQFVVAKFLIANFLNVQKWGMLNSYTGMVITSLVGGTDIFLIRQSFMQMPRDLSEAAIMDGCGRIRFLFSIGIPMAMPAITSLAITGFIGAYNMYFWPLLVAQTKDMQTIQIGMAMIRGLEVAQYGSILAGAVVCAVIPIILFIFAQDFIIKGLSTGSVKG